MKITWLGHASFMLNVDDKIIYIDPYAGDYELKADFILISHEHHDHFSREKINKVITTDTILVGSNKVSRQMKGIKGLSPGDERTFEGITIKAVHAYNIDKPFHPKGSGIGFIIETKDKTIYFAGDTDLIPEMSEIKTDVAILPVGGTYSMNSEEAAKAVAKIKPKIAIPMHMASDVTLDDAKLFKKLVEAKPGTKVRILKQGETISV